MRRRCPMCPSYDFGGGKTKALTGVTTNWRPGEGLNPRLRQFRCPQGHVYYVTITDSQLQAEIKREWAKIKGGERQ